MFQPTIARPFLGKSWVIFMMFFLLYYILQLGLALMCCNFYSQSNPVRLLPFSYEVVEGNVTVQKQWVPKDFDCNIPSINAQAKEDFKTKKLEYNYYGYSEEQFRLSENYRVYDTAFLLVGIFHTIEWFRTLVLLVSTTMGGVFLLKFYYITAINAFYGFVAYIFAHYAYFSENGVACAEKQATRNQFLLAEIILFYVIYAISILFILAFPKMAFGLAQSAYNRRQAAKAAEAEEEAK